MCYTQENCNFSLYQQWLNVKDRPGAKSLANRAHQTSLQATQEHFQLGKIKRFCGHIADVDCSRGWQSVFKCPLFARVHNLSSDGPAASAWPECLASNAIPAQQQSLQTQHPIPWVQLETRRRQARKTGKQTGERTARCEECVMRSGRDVLQVSREAHSSTNEQQRTLGGGLLDDSDAGQAAPRCSNCNVRPDNSHPSCVMSLAADARGE